MNKIVLTIECTPEQPGIPLHVRVTGPLGDKLTCYGLLELARDKIREFQPPAIIPVAQFPVNGIKRQ